MKRAFFVLGMAVLILSFGMVFVSCSDDDGNTGNNGNNAAILVVENQHATLAITKVFYLSNGEIDANIPPGQEKSFNLNIGEDSYFTRLGFEDENGTIKITNNGNLLKGRTTRIRYMVNGTIVVVINPVP